MAVWGYEIFINRLTHHPCCASVTWELLVVAEGSLLSAFPRGRESSGISKGAFLSQRSPRGLRGLPWAGVPEWGRAEAPA